VPQARWPVQSEPGSVADQLIKKGEAIGIAIGEARGEARKDSSRKIDRLYRMPHSKCRTQIAWIYPWLAVEPGEYQEVAGDESFNPPTMKLSCGSFIFVGFSSGIAIASNFVWFNRTGVWFVFHRWNNRIWERCLQVFG